PLTAGSLDAFRPAARAKDIGLESPIEPVRPILGDPTPLQEILWNLLSNALKFTPQRGRVQVGLVQAAAAAQITVADAGVGNEPDSRDLFTLLLQEGGALVTAATSAGEALALLDSRTVDVIVADIGLPDMDGYAFIRQVRGREDGGPHPHHIPALALTAYAR